MQRSDRRVGAALLILVITGACAPFMRTPAAPLAASDAYVESQQRLAAAAHGRLQAALDAQDTVGVAASLATTVRIVTPNGDTASGDVVLSYLMFIAGDRTRPLRLGPGKFAPCLNGDVYEYDGDLTAPPRSGTYQSGRFAILWGMDDQPGMIRRLVLSKDRQSLRGAVPCQFEYKWAASQRKWTGTVAVEMSQPAPSLGARDVRQAMRNRGLSYAVGTENTGPGDRPFPQIEPQRGSLTLGLRRRADAVHSIEMQAGIRLPETVTGYDSSTKRYVSATGLPLTASLLMQYQRGSIRMGFGPAVLVGNWRVTEEQRTLTRKTITFRPSGGRSDATITWTSWDAVAGSSPTATYGVSPAIGLASDVAIMHALSRRVVAEFHFSGAAFTRSRLPGTPGFEGASASNSVLRLGVSLARGW